MSSQSLNHWDFLVSTIPTSVSRSTQVLLLTFSIKPLHLTQMAVMADYEWDSSYFLRLSMAIYQPVDKYLNAERLNGSITPTVEPCNVGRHEFSDELPTRYPDELTESISAGLSPHRSTILLFLTAVSYKIEDQVWLSGCNIWITSPWNRS